MPPFKVEFQSDRSIGGFAVADDSFVDQALDVFKANILFKQFKIETDGDRTLVYVTLYILDCLKRLQKAPNRERATQAMKSAALEDFSLPGDAKFPLNSFYPKPPTKQQKEELQKYMTQLRQATGLKLVERVFQESDNRPSKWWTCWSKRKFLNVT